MSRLSLAQTLPPELLSHIFGWLVEMRSRETPNTLRYRPKKLLEWTWTANIPDLRAFSLVCRQWRPQAQQMLFRSILLYEVDDEKLLDRLRVQPELAAAVRVLDVRLDSEDFVLDLESDDCARVNRRPGAICNTRLSILELCTRACHIVIGGVVPEQRERLVGILNGLRLKPIVYSEWDWGGNWPPEVGPVHLAVLELVSLAQPPSLLRNFDPDFRKPRTAYNQLLAPFRSLYWPVPALSVSFF